MAGQVLLSLQHGSIFFIVVPPFNNAVEGPNGAVHLQSAFVCSFQVFPGPSPQLSISVRDFPSISGVHFVDQWAELCISELDLVLDGYKCAFGFRRLALPGCAASYAVD